MQRFLHLQSCRCVAHRLLSGYIANTSKRHLLQPAQLASSCTRSLTSWSSPTRPETEEHDERNEGGDEDLRLEDDGEYEVVVPRDPYARPLFPPPRPVPAHIVRPPYARDEILGSWNTSVGAERIQLGSDEEKKLRRAAGLARRVLNYAGTLAKVSSALRRSCAWC